MKEQFKERLQELDRLEKLATPGEWHLGISTSNPSRTYIAHRSNGLCMESDIHSSTDHRFCILLRNNARLLIDEGLKLVEENERLRESLEQHQRLLVNLEDTALIQLPIQHGALPDCTDNSGNAYRSQWATDMFVAAREDLSQGGQS